MEETRGVIGTLELPLPENERDENHLYDQITLALGPLNIGIEILQHLGEAEKHVSIIDYHFMLKALMESAMHKIDADFEAIDKHLGNIKMYYSGNSDEPIGVRLEMKSREPIKVAIR